MTSAALPFENLPIQRPPRNRFGGGSSPIWTENKAKLIHRYLHYFIWVTKHGTYIDGFAGPQRRHAHSLWSANLVLGLTPKWLRTFVLCDCDAKQVEALERLRDRQPPRNANEPRRKIEVLAGDFNQIVGAALSHSRISEKTAAFCLLDQRTFECHWQTVVAVATHKKVGPKIEIFYFLAVGWFQRALSRKNNDALLKWWGRADYTNLKGMSSVVVAEAMVQRFESELGYTHVKTYPIRKRRGSGPIMYYMIHATDNDVAPTLMERAYRSAVTPLEPPDQLQLMIASLR